MAEVEKDLVAAAVLHHSAQSGVCQRKGHIPVWKVAGMMMN